MTGVRDFQGQSSHSMKLVTLFNPDPRLRLCGATPLIHLYAFMVLLQMITEFIITEVKVI
jgi:hypothetical protein